MRLGMMQVAAQSAGTVSGFVKEKASDLPMEFATVVLHKAGTESMENGCMTDSTGLFLLENVSEGTYYVEGSYVGCTPVRSEMFTLKKGQSLDIGTLFITEGEQLSEVVVEGRRQTLVAKPDRKVFNVAQDLMSTSGSAGDLMQHIPSVDMDLDGNVSLRGNSNVTILINGKPSAMMGTKTRGDALAQLPASSIESIEVITAPSAEYKPDGMSGIINIVLKKDAKPGMNGTINANVGSYSRQNTGIDLNYGSGKYNVFGGYTFRRDRYDRSIIDHRTSSSSDIIDQTTCGVGRPVSHTMRLGMNASLTKKDMLEVAGSYNRRRFRRSEQVVSTTENTGGELLDSYHRDRSALAKENMWEATMKYAHRYGKDNEWGADYSYSSESEDEMNHYSTLRMEEREKNNEAVWDARRLHTAGLYLRHNISDGVKLAAGYGVEHLRAEQNYHVTDWDGTEFVLNTGRSSDFTHLMTLHSLYATAEMNAGRWNASAGLRAEYADIANRLISQGKDLTQDYFNLYPSLHLSRDMGGGSELMMNYSLRVNRPEGSDMNPFAEQINPLSLEAGNPDLKPEKTHSLEVGGLWRTGGGSLMSTIYYRYITNQITLVSRYIDAGVLLTTKENLQSGQNAGVELVWSLPVARWFDFNLNANGYYDRIDASLPGFGKKKDTFSYSALMNADFRPVNRYMIQLNARYRSATLVPQGRRDADLRINLGMKYDIPALNLSVIASVTDLLDTYRKSYTLDTPQLKQKVEKRRNPRIFYVGISWQFGSGKAKKHHANPEYDEGL